MYDYNDNKVYFMLIVKIYKKNNIIEQQVFFYNVISRQWIKTDVAL